MKKIASILGIAMLLAMSMVSAIPTGFELTKLVDVTGDWKWNGASWTLPSPQPITANVMMHSLSPLATVASYTETEVMGTAWKYSLSSVMQSNAGTGIQNTLNAVTVNPPTTTPGTDWTKYTYGQITQAQYSSSSVNVNGYGFASIQSNIQADGSVLQSVVIGINQ